MTNLEVNYKCPVCYTSWTEYYDNEEALTEEELSKDRECSACYEKSYVICHYINDSNATVIELGYDWNDETEKWPPFVEIREGSGSSINAMVLNADEYSSLNKEEKNEFNICEVCNNAFEKYTGICRKDENSGLMICEDCK